MKNTFIILLSFCFFAACKKDKNTPGPTASFTFGYNTATDFRLATSDTTTLTSSVTNASSINWDLGDGRKSTENKLVLSYPKAGTYKVTLTVTSGDGKKVTVSKNVTVLDLVLKSIVINNVYWNTTDPEFVNAGWPLTNTADVYVKIQQLQGNGKDVFLPNGFVPSAPVIYTSPVIKNVSSSTTTPLGITVSSKITLDKPLLSNNRTYLISLMAKNTTAEYVLFSNWYSGSDQVVKTDDIEKNKFMVHASFFSSMDLNFDFE